ncbi:hypothetical protein DWX76_10105 [Clostridium sp. AF21-20LB]|nr:hypothetical protein DWX76_10105 [Clostridium sp. AF21-20LB]
MKQKSAPRGCALARSRNMSQATALGARMCQGTFFYGCMSGAKQDSCQSRCILARGSRKQNIYEGKQN